MKNEKEFLDLIESYKRIDIDQLNEIAENWEEESTEEWGQEVLSEITGFGTRGNCTLCKAVKIQPSNNFENSIEMQARHKKECSTCAYTILTGNGCFSSINHYTYWHLENAISTNELKKAIDARALHMETIYNNFKNYEK